MKKLFIGMLSLFLGSSVLFGQSVDQLQKIVASDRQGSDLFGRSVSISGDYMVVGAYSEDEDASGGNTLNDAGSVYVYERNDTGDWEEVQKVVASDREVSDYFGTSVSISGDYLVVGASYEDEDASGGNTLGSAGSAYVYERNGAGVWVEVQKIVASDRGVYDYFGTSVSISGDYMVVGAYSEDEDASGGNTLNDAGSAYVYERNGTGDWEEVQKIVASDREADDSFGYSVSISGDYLVVAARYDEKSISGENTLINAGSAYVYERNDTGDWEEVQKIVASDREADDLFGTSVSISGDYLVVGASHEDEDASGGNTLNTAGSAYVYERIGGFWTEVQKIVASDREANDNFGYRVSISGDYLVVGAFLEDDDASGLNNISGAGSVYVFKRGASVWEQDQKIVAGNRKSGDYFGYSVSISGYDLVVGAYNEDEDADELNPIDASGSAYIFSIPVPQDNCLSLVSQSRITLPTSDLAPPWTIETWVYKENFSGAASRLATHSDGVSGISLEQWNNTEEVGITEIGVADHTFNYILTNQVWQHMAVVCNGSNMVLFINGEQVGNAINGTIYAPMRYLGNSNASYSAIAKIDEYRVWNKALSSTQIKAMMGQEIQRNGTSVQGTEDLTYVSGLNWSDLQLYYRFNETSGTDPRDSSSNGNNGTGVNVTESNWVSSGTPYVWDGSASSDWGTLANWQDRGRGTIPGIADNIVIDNDAINDLTIADARSANNFVISNGATVNINPAGALTLSGVMEVNGAESLILNSDATETANLVDNGIEYKNSGSIKVESFIPLNNGADYLQGYHYISSPVNNHLKFTDMTDLYSYNEPTLEWVHHSGFTNFTNAKGYAIRYDTAITKEYTGSTNTGSQSIAVTYNDNPGSSFDHFNLVGNPYPSSISADALITANSSVIEANVYFWNGVDYATYNTSLSSGTAGSQGGTPDGNIAVGQAFFVDSKPAAGTLNFTDAMRGTDSDIFYREASYPELRVLVSNTVGKSDLWLTGHQASTFGKDDYDARHLPGDGNLSLSALLDGTPYDIQSVPQLNGHVFDLQVVAKQDGEVNFNLQEAKNLDGMKVYLEDKEMGTVTDISVTRYTAQVVEGVDNNRFKLRIGKEENTFNELIKEENVFNTWINDGRLEFSLEDVQVMTARLITIDGKIVARTTNFQFSNWSQLSNGIYLLEVETNKGKQVQKIVK